jgi:hypothetical protein
MTYKKDITEILENLISEVNNEVNVLSWTEDNGVITMVVDDMLWTQIDWIFTFNCRTVEDMNFHSTQCVITDAYILGSTHVVSFKGVTETLVSTDMASYEVPHVYFFHGTPIAVGAELDKINNANNKTPMVWMMENFQERFYDDPLLRLERETTLRLFFLTQANHRQWVTQQAYDHCIAPMRRLLELFVEVIKNDGTFDVTDLTYSVYNYAKFGVYINEKGMPTNKFADNLSGVEMSFVLKRYKPDCCDC